MKSSKDVARKPGQTNNQAPTQGANKTSQPGTTAKTGGATSTTARTGSATPKTGTKPGTPAGRPATTSVRSSAQRRPVQKKGGFRMRPVDAIITGVAVVVIALIVGALWLSANPPGQAGSAETTHLLASGTQAPDFSLPGTDGKTYTLSQFKGKPVVLEFMAPWCPHCQEDSVVFNKAYNDYKDKGIVMLGINASPYGKDYSRDVTPPITMDDQKWFAQNFGVPYPLLYDAPTGTADSPDLAQRQAYGIDYFPTVYFIDKEGKVANTMLADQDNPITYERTANEIEKILK